jgi:hypothetical protein
MGVCFVVMMVSTSVAAAAYFAHRRRFRMNGAIAALLAKRLQNNGTMDACWLVTVAVMRL